MGSNAIGETNMFPDKKGKAKQSFRINIFLAKRDQDGHVITAPRNFTTKKSKKGKDDSVYFGRPSYNCKGDLY